MSPEPESIIRSLPCWRGRITIAPLAGGLSNAAFKVADSEGTYVARLGQDFPFHHVSRRREAEASRAAYAAGVAPRVVFAGGGALVSDFVAGRTLESADFRARLDALVALIARYHRDMRRLVHGEAAAFWPFHVIRDYARALRAGARPIAADLPRLVEIAAELEDAQMPATIIFGHHDLLPGNVIDDGDRLWLIDWEYAGFGAPMFDLANLADNGGFDETQEHRLLQVYYGAAPDRARLRAFSAMKVASALREALWASVSEIHLKAPGADYGEYAAKCLVKFEAAHKAYRERF